MTCSWWRSRARGALLLTVLLGPAVDAKAAPAASPDRFAGSANLDRFAGRADVVVRDVTVTGRDGRRSREVAASSPLRSGDTIEVGPSSAVRLRFADGAKLSLGPGSRASIERFRYDPATGDGYLLANVTAGAFEFAPGAMGDEHYDVATPLTRVALRGGSFAVDVANEAILVIDGETEARLLGGDALSLKPTECAVREKGGRSERLDGPLCGQRMPVYQSLLGLLRARGEEGPLARALSSLPSPDRARAGPAPRPTVPAAAARPRAPTPVGAAPPLSPA